MQKKKAEAKRDGVINIKLQFQSILTLKIVMLSKLYESTEVNSITWLNVPSWSHWSSSSDTHQVVEKYRET